MISRTTERKEMTVAELIAELQACDPNASISVWNMDSRAWELRIFLDEFPYGNEKNIVRLGSHVYDADERRAEGLDR